MEFITDSNMKRIAIFLAMAVIASACRDNYRPLPRAEAPEILRNAFEQYLQDVQERDVNMHSIMVLQHGKVLLEKQFAPDTAHIMMSVSKTFTSTAVGFAISEGLLSLDERIVDIFPGQVPPDPQPWLGDMTIRHLLTMNSGHGTDPTNGVWKWDRGDLVKDDWVEFFMQWPIEYEPGSCYCYNSLGTYVLSAAVQKLSGQKVVDYLEKRLWEPLGIEKPRWDESPSGVNYGGWGLYLHTEDMARMGQCLLQGGVFNGRQVIPADWVREMSARQVDCVFAGTNSIKAAEAGIDPSGNDWMQGYGYQMWRCTHGAFRADGAFGQYIIVMPDQDAVVVTTAGVKSMAEELYLIWKNIYPALDELK